MRQIIFDTETTGLNISDHNRVIEIGCVEVLNRQITGKTWHCYINPQRDSEPGALQVHGLTTEFLADKPLFSEIAEGFIEFIRGAELIAHNAKFDVDFLNHELKLDGNRFGRLEDHCTITDTLLIARSKHPGARVTLDALCSRYQVDNSGRDLHGALIDADLLAQVYLLMTGGQTGLELGGSEGGGAQSAEAIRRVSANLPLPVMQASAEELELHRQYLEMVNKQSGGNCIWQRLEQ